MKLRRILTVLVFTLMAFQSQATHQLGGEIIWKCKPNGKYQFTMILYRECGSSVTLPTTTQTLSGPQSVSVNYITTQTVTPSCYAGTEPCQAGTGLSGLGRMQKYIYRSGDIVLTGSPPASGWTFSWTSCCRPQSVGNITNAGSQGYYLRATMYPYIPPGSTTPLTGGSAANPTCYDSSPDFLEDPQVVACSNQDVVYNNLGYDPDLDSLYYVWANPLGTGGAVVPWASGYSANSPLPSGSGSTAANLDGETGTVTFNSTQTGSFATCVSIEAWRCGQKVAEIFRDIPVVIRSCTGGTGTCASLYNPVPPQFTVTPDSSLAAPTLLAPVTNTAGDTVAYRTEGYPGDTIRFELLASDPYVNPNCANQNITLVAKGGNLSSATNYSNPNTCLFNPPCATLTSQNTGNSFTSSGINSVKFNWNLECNHLFYQEYICGTLKSEYEFYFRMQDDQCPVPLTSYAKVIVKVKNYMPELPSLDSTCITHDGSGVTFDWVANPDTGFNFDYYLINYIDSNGNQSVLDTITDWSTQSYTHSNVSPTAIHSYYIQVAGGCGLLSESTDTLRNVNLILTKPYASPFTHSVAHLNWNSWMKGDDSTIYTVHRRKAGSLSWDLLGTTMDTTWNDSVNYCSEDLHYAVSYPSSCWSNDPNDQFIDNILPKPIVLDSVTVASGNLAAMSWQGSSDSDVVYYRIYRKDNGGFFQPIDSISVADHATSMPWIYPLSNAENESETYLITAVDSCGNQSTVGNTIPSSTIFLNLGVDPCDGYARIRWNTYKEWTQTQPAVYNLYADITDPLGATLTGVLLKGGNLDTTFNHYGIINGYTYCYYVRAVDTTGTITSTSNRVCNSSAVVQGSKVLYLGRASVNSQNGVDLYAYIDKDADVIDFNVQRADDEIGPYMTIGTVAKPALGPWEVKFIDFTGDPTSRRYYYRIASRDSCGALDTLSNLATNILLNVEAIGNLTNQLIWTKYRDFDAGVELYEIYRSTNGGGSFELAGTTADTAFLDDIKPYANSKGKFCYYVKAVAKDGVIPWRDEFGMKFNARSNVACTVHKARLWFPSAFNPKSDVVENRVWKPQGVFARADSYTLYIQNRWGQEVFRTNNLNEGWDGMINGKPAQTGIYTYFIRYRSIEDVPVEDRGNFTLL